MMPSGATSPRQPKLDAAAAIRHHQTLRLLKGRFRLERTTHAPEVTVARETLAIVSGPDGPTAARRDDTAEDAWAALWNGDVPHDPLSAGMLSAIVAPLAAADLPVWVASSLDGDLVLVPAECLDEAVRVLRAAGHHLSE